MEVGYIFRRLVVRDHLMGQGWVRDRETKTELMVVVAGDGDYHLSLGPSPHCGPPTDRLCVPSSQRDPKLPQLV